MSHLESSTAVMMLGTSGLVANTAFEVIGRTGLLHVEGAVSASGEHVGKFLGELGVRGPDSIRGVRITSLEEALKTTESSIIYSCLRDESARENEMKFAELGKLVVTNSPANRMRSDVALGLAYFHRPSAQYPTQVDERLANKDKSEGAIIAGGNCVADIVATGLFALQESIGIDHLDVKTLQGWSGAGVKNVPDNAVGRRVRMEPEAGAKEKQKVEEEIPAMLGHLGVSAAMSVEADIWRAPWVSGHHITVAAVFERETSQHEIEDVWQSFQSPKELHDLTGKYMPAIWPIDISTRPLLNYWGQTPRLEAQHPMRIRARVVEVDRHDPRRARLEFAGDNLMLGAAAGNIMHILYALRRGYIQAG